MDHDNPLWKFLFKVRDELKARGLLHQGDNIIQLPGEVMDELLMLYADEEELEQFLECQLKYENYAGAEGIKRIMIRRGFRKKEDPPKEE